MDEMSVSLMKKYIEIMTENYNLKQEVIARDLRILKLSHDLKLAPKRKPGRPPGSLNKESIEINKRLNLPENTPHHN